GRGQRLLEAADVPVPLARGRAEGNQVVVVEGDAGSAPLGELVDGLDRVEGLARGVAEGIAALPADGPEAEGEAVGGGGGGHHVAPICCAPKLIAGTLVDSGRRHN